MVSDLYTAAEILSASSALKAAHIQADATIKAAWWAAAGIIVGLIVSWRTGLSLQKKSRVAETRREIYVEAVGAYSRLTSVIATISLDPSTALHRLLEAVEHFTQALDKAMFVSQTTTKAEIVKFYEFFIPALGAISANLGRLINTYEELEQEKERHVKAMEQLNNIWEKLDDFSIDNPIHEKIKNALDLISSKIERSYLIIESIDKAETLFLEERRIMIEDFDKLHIQLNDKALDVMYLLRQEIGIDNNKPLDKILNDKLKNIANSNE